MTEIAPCTQRSNRMVGAERDDAPPAQRAPVVEAGVKYDDHKPRFSMLFDFGRALIAIVRVSEYGARKYPERKNWQKLDDGEDRYLSAALRHLAAMSEGEEFDSESKISHFAHFSWNSLAALYHHLKNHKIQSHE